MKKYLTLILLLSCIGILHAQGWSVQLVHPSRPYIYSEDLWHCYVTNPDTTSREITLYCWVIHDGEEIAHGRSNSITVSPGRNHITSRDINDVTDEHYVDPYEDILERRGALPAGSYTFCVRVEDAVTHSEFASNCHDYAARGAGVLRLISPMDDATVHMENPTFIWAPLSPAGSVDHYSIRIVQIPEDMCADEAMSSAEPWYEDDDINTTNFRYPLSARTLSDGENYAWQVNAFGESDIAISTSDIWDVTIGTPGTEPDGECECIGWESLEVEVNEYHYSIDCQSAPDTIPLGTIALGTEITIVPDYHCEGDPDLCAVTYEGTVIPPAGSLPIPLTSYDYMLTETGCYQFEITPICDGDSCETCTFVVCCDDSCNCGGWGESLEVEVNGSTHVIDCSIGQDTIKVAYIVPATPITITPDYICIGDPVACPLTYTGTLISPPSPPFEEVIPTFTGSFTCYSKSVPGCYDFTIFAWCDDDLCDTCTFVICTDSISPPTCECGGWESLNVTWNNQSQSIIPLSYPDYREINPESIQGFHPDPEIAPDTIHIVTGATVTVNGSYFCLPESYCCLESYEWEVIEYQMHGSASGIPIVYSTGSSTCQFSFTVEKNNCYQISIYPYCNDIMCERDIYSFIVCTVDSNGSVIPIYNEVR